MDIFIKWLEEDVKAIANIEVKEMIITKEEEKQFNKASDCWICGEELGNDRVRDHNHYTGLYRGPAHNICNLKYNKPNSISVFFHNLAGYDSHLFIKKLGFTEGNIDCIPNNEEKYISFSKTIKTGKYTNKKGETKNKTFKIVFKDSLKFMSSSLGALVNNLPKDTFNNLLKYYTPEQAELLKQKGFYPYEYMNTEEKFKDKELHDLHNDYPFCPERVKCDNGVEKLIPNLRDKNKYVIHYRNLIQCLKAGMKLKKIHRGIKFIESAWLKPYIDKNTYLRTQAKNNFEKDFFKLMNNSVFGKTMENIRNRVIVKLVNTKEKLKKLVAKPNYRSCKIFNENLVSVHMKKTSLTMNKPVYLGMCILDLSKIIMFDFHYNYIKPKYGNNAKLLFTDTDSLFYEIQTEDFYKDISGDVNNRFDTSDYPENHPSDIPTGINKKVLGMMKDEAEGKNIKEFVGLRSKLYSFIMEDGGENKKCKGVKKQVVESSITHEDYKTCLTTGKELLRKQNIIRSYNHEVYTEEVNKIALSATDDKRYILKDGMHTLAWGHYKIKDN